MASMTESRLLNLWMSIAYAAAFIAFVATTFAMLVRASIFAWRNRSRRYTVRQLLGYSAGRDRLLARAASVSLAAGVFSLLFLYLTAEP